MYERLEGKRIVLRKALLKDWPSMYQNIWSNKEVYERMLFQPTLSEEDAILRCERSIQFQQIHYGYFVALNDTDEAIGLCGVKENEPGKYEECGIAIAPKLQNQGYGKELLALLLDLVFSKLGGTDFEYGYYVDNEKSKMLAKHFGFKFLRKERIIRKWDNACKEVEIVVLTRDEYFNFLYRNKD